MKQWEYRFALLNVASKNRTEALKRLNELGGEGWELVLIYNSPPISTGDDGGDEFHDNQDVAVFKRPVA